MDRNQELALFLKKQESELRRIELPAGESLFDQGEIADAMYVVLSGRLRVILQTDAQNIDIDDLTADAVVGEMGLLTGRPRNASVEAVEDSVLLRIDIAAYERLSKQNTSLFEELSETTQPRWQRVQLAEILTEIFGELDAALLKQIQARLNWIHLSHSDVLARQGDEADSMYIVVNGRVQFTVEEEGGVRRNVGWAGRGESVGEFALLSGGIRSATISAVRQTDVVEITRELSDELTLEHPQFMRSIARMIVERQQRDLGVLSQVSMDDALSITLMPVAGDTNLQLFAEQLAAALDTYGKTLILDATQFDKLYGRSGASQVERDDPSHSAIVSWINEQERTYEYLLFLPDSDWSSWTRRCLGQSDRVLLVGRTGDDPKRGEFETLALENYPDIRFGLALWHSAEIEKPTNTAAWLAERQVAKHYHVRDGDVAHFGRLARRLTGHAITLCLAGGGARGYVHLGVYKAFEELNIPIDMVCGTSFGALIGAKFAQQEPFEAIMEDVRKYARNDDLFDRTLPLVALNSSANLDRFCEINYGDAQIEDLWLPFFAIATNLTQASVEIIEHGSLADTIRKSVAIPGVFAPVIADGDMIVDGGVMNNFPVDIAIEKSESKRVIGIHCAPKTSRRRSYDMTTNISGWRVLSKRLNPFAKNPRVPSIASTIMRSFDVNSLKLARTNERLCELLLQPQPTKFSVLDFERYPDIVKLGYDESIADLTKWRSEQNDLA